MRIAKQRHGEWEGLFNFWFDIRSQQWIPEHGHGPMPFPPPEAKVMESMLGAVA